MKLTSKVATLLLVGLMATTSFAAIARAETATKPVAETKAAAKPVYATQTQMLRMSQEARTALMSAQAARLSLFNDKIDQAKADVEKGIQALESADKTLQTAMIPGTDAADDKAEYLPFDSKMTLSETFTVTPEKKVALDKATDLFEAKTPQKALDVLRDASVDVVVSTALLPGEPTLKEMRNAHNLIVEGKYHGANVVLKSIEDSVIVRSFGIDAIPVQGAQAG